MLAGRQSPGVGVRHSTHLGAAGSVPVTGGRQTVTFRTLVGLRKSFQFLNLPRIFNVERCFCLR